MTGGRAKIEALLKAHPDGLTRKQIADMLGIAKESVRSALSLMPHAYVDRWVAVQVMRHVYQWAAVYVLADMPPDMPMPNRRPTEDDYKRELFT
jgi:chromosome segregation and condensation protein ScpB